MNVLLKGTSNKRNHFPWGPNLNKVWKKQKKTSAFMGTCICS